MPKKRYQYRLSIGYSVEGKRQYRVFSSYKSERDARKKALEWQKQQAIAEATGTVQAEDYIAFAPWARRWLEVYKKPHVSANTYALTYKNTVEKHIIPYFGKADLRAIRTSDVQAFYVSKQNELSGSMMDKCRMCLVSIFDAAIEEQLLFRNPAKSKTVTCSSAKAPAAKRVYTDAQVAQICAVPDVDPILPVLLQTGLRRGELCGLMWSDFDAAARTLAVNRSIATAPDGSFEVRPPKWNSYRTIPLPDTLVELLAAQPRCGLYIFPHRAGEPYRPDTMAHRITGALRRALPPGVEILTPHELRHTFGTSLYRRGVDIYAIQKVMGHKDIRVTTQTYVHAETDALRRSLHLDVPAAAAQKG